MNPIINQFLQEKLTRFLEEKSDTQGGRQSKKPHLQILRTKIQQEKQLSKTENENLKTTPDEESEESFNHFLKEDLN